MESTSVAAVAAMLANNPHMVEEDMISFDSDSSGDSKLRRSLERKFLTPHRRPPSEHRDGVPADSPKRRNSKNRQRPRSSSYQSECSPVPYSWYYNPYSQRDYSPSVASVTPRKSISTWMDAMMRTPSDRNLQKHEQVDNDDSSVDSIEQLERAALRIRSEIRQLEMKELADEAEQAAEAGLESFAGRASTFGDSTHSLDYVDLNHVNPKQQYKLKRYSTYSEGASLLTQVRPLPRPRPKIRCLQLRDISEVIPPIGELHLHLKTHLALAGVEQQRSMAPAASVMEKNHVDDKRAKTPVQFLKSLKSWVSTSPSRGSDVQSPNTDIASNVTTPRQSTVPRSNKTLLDSLQVDNDDDDGECSVSSFTSMGSYEVGGRLAGHLHAPRAVRRSPIRIPSGLDLPEDLGIPHEVPVKILLNDVDRTDVDTVETVPTSSSSQQGDSNQDNTESSARDLEDLPQIELFPRGDDDSVEDQASHLETDLGLANVFLTPMRLRGIRKASRRLSSEGASADCQSADLGWELDVVRHSKSEPQAPVEVEHSLSIPLLTAKSDGARCSPVAPLNRSEDVNMSYLSLEEPTANDLLSLERPKSLSFDEHDAVGVIEQKLLPEPTTDEEDEEDLICTEDFHVDSSAEEKLNDVCLDGQSNGVVQSMPSRDLSLVVAPSDEIQFSMRPARSNEALVNDGNENSMDEANVNRNSSGMSCNDLSLPLMPTLEKIDEPKHADESIVKDVFVEADLDFPITTAQFTPKIEKRASTCSESDLIVRDIETDNSVHSLELEEVFSASELCSVKAADPDTQLSRSLTEIAYSVRMEAAGKSESGISSSPEGLDTDSAASLKDNNSVHSLELEEVFSVSELCSVKAVDPDTQRSGSLTEIAYSVRMEAAGKLENGIASPPEGLDADTAASLKDNDSVHSLELEEVFSASELCSVKAVDPDTQRSRSLTEIAYSVRMEAAGKSKNGIASLSEDVKGDISEIPNEAAVSLAGTPEESPKHAESEPRASLYHQVSLFDSNKEMNVDEEHDEAIAASDSKSEMGRPDDEHSLEESQATVAEHDCALPTEGPPEQVSIEVNDLNDSPSDYHSASEDQSPSRASRREEIVRSPTGRVRVTIEQPSLQDVLDDESDCSDDDVRSEADSVRTPQPSDCECLINVATQLEGTVGVDLAKAGECALARYDLSFVDARDEKNASIVSAPGQFPAPPESPAKKVFRQPSIPKTGNMSPLRRSLSCPSFLAVAAEADEPKEPIQVIPHKGSSPERRASMTSVSDRALTCGRREYFRSSTVLDPCQSTSPFKETMDDMMKSFSPRRSLESEMKLRVRAEENHEFLSNYLYCSKPPGQPGPETQKGQDVICAEHCDYLSGVLDVYRSIVPKRATKDMLSLNADDESYASAAPETWFDVASEHFDGALETFMGRAHAQSRRWNSMFQRPGLKSKKENPKTPKKDVQGILLVQQQSAISHDGELTDQQFGMMYGMTREEFARLPVTERSALHDFVSDRKKGWSTRSISQVTMGSMEPPSPAISARSLSSSNLVRMEHMKI